MKRLETRIRRLERRLDTNDGEWQAAIERVSKLMTDEYGPIPMPLNREQPQISAEDEAAVLAMLEA